MLDCARERFAAELDGPPEQIVELMEITMRNLLVTGEIDLKDFLARADMLAATGKIVLISDYLSTTAGRLLSGTPPSRLL